MALLNLNKFYEVDEDRTKLLLLMPIIEYGEITCLQLAIFAELKTFVSHAATQKCLTELWHGRILAENLSKRNVTINFSFLKKIQMDQNFYYTYTNSL